MSKKFTKEQLEKFAKAREELDKALSYTTDEKDPRRNTTEQKLKRDEQMSIDYKKRYAKGTEEYEKLAERNRQTAKDPNWLESVKNVWTEEKREENSAHSKAKWADDEFRATHRESMEKVWSDPAWRKRRSEAAAEMHQDPEYQEHMQKIWEEKRNNPEVMAGIKAKKLKYLEENYDEWYAKFSKGNNKLIQERKDSGFYKELGKKNANNPVWRKKQKAAAEMRKGVPNDKNAKAIICEGVEYKSLQDAAKAYNITSSAMTQRIQRNPDFFCYKEVGLTPVKLWYYVTPKGTFVSLTDAEKANNLSAYKIKGLILKNEPGYEYKQFIRKSHSEKNSNLWKKGIDFRENKG